MATTLAVSTPPSPFRDSHRRSRSHSSLSTPSSSPVSRQHNEQWRLPTRRVANAAPYAFKSSDRSFIRHDFAAQPPSKWDVDMWRRGKRPRRDLSTSLDVDADMESCDDDDGIRDEPMPLLASGSLSSSIDAYSAASARTVAPHHASTDTPSSSPSSLPCTSSAFNFFPTKRRSESQQKRDSAADSVPSSHVNPAHLSQLHAEAYTELRKSVTEAGEGFVKRMQEWEERRSRTDPSDKLQSSSLGMMSEREEDPSDSSLGGTMSHKRGCKRPSPCSPSISSRHLTATVKQIKRDDAETSYDDDDSDVEIVSTNVASQAAQDDLSRWSPMKKRAVSLGGMELSYATSHSSSLSGALFSFNDTPNERATVANLVSSDRQRSSSPLDVHTGSPGSASSISSSDEGEHDDGIRLRLDRTQLACRRRFRSRRHQHSPSQSRCSASAASARSSMAPSLSFSFSSNSRNSSITSLVHGGGSMPTPSSVPEGGVWWGCDSTMSTGGINASSFEEAPLPSSKTERAVAALTLALEHSAGSVSDYEALRAAQGAVADQDSADAGNLWD